MVEDIRQLLPRAEVKSRHDTYAPSLTVVLYIYYTNICECLRAIVKLITPFLAFLAPLACFGLFLRWKAHVLAGEDKRTLLIVMHVQSTSYWHMIPHKLQSNVFISGI